jgi:hypothetical protein
MHEDQRTYVAVGLAGPVYVSDEPLSTYTTRPDSVYGSALGRDPMVVVRQHLAFEQWVASYARRRGVAGLGVVGALAARRLERGISRRARLAWARLPRPGGAPSA